jgi:hypothetical protein
MLVSFQPPPSLQASLKHRPQSHSTRTTLLYHHTPFNMLAQLWLLPAAFVAFAGRSAFAEIHEGPTGVEYAKRFEPSIAACVRLCPNLNVSLLSGLLIVAVSSGGVQTVPGGPTTCSYTYLNDALVCVLPARRPPSIADGVFATEIQEVVVTDTCVYAQDGLLTSSTVSIGSSCPLEAALSPGCTLKRRRDETRLQKVVRERQWKGPHRR